MKSFSFLFLLAVFANEAHSQDSTRSYQWELSGTISYSYSNQSEQNFRTYRDFLQYFHIHRWSVQPSIGYFLVPGLEVMTDVRYTFVWTEFNLMGNQPAQQVVVNQWSHNLGFVVGPVYNHPVTSSTYLFLGLKFGLGWTRWGFTNFDYPPDSGWKKAEVSFPVIAGGTKIFLSERWALILQGQYVRTTNFDGNDNMSNSTVAGGVGVSVFL